MTSNLDRQVERSSNRRRRYPIFKLSRMELKTIVAAVAIKNRFPKIVDHVGVLELIRSTMRYSKIKVALDDTEFKKLVTYLKSKGHQEQASWLQEQRDADEASQTVI